MSQLLLPSLSHLRTSASFWVSGDPFFGRLAAHERPDLLFRDAGEAFVDQLEQEDRVPLREVPDPHVPRSFQLTIFRKSASVVLPGSTLSAAFSVFLHRS